MNTLLSVAATHGPTVLAVDPAKVKPGWLALVIILLIGLATYLLWRSMNRQLRKVDFDDGVDRSTDRAARDGVPREGSDPAGSTSGEGSADGNGGASHP